MDGVSHHWERCCQLRWYLTVNKALQKQYKAMRIQTISTLIPTITLQTDPPKKVLVNVERFFNVTESNHEHELKEYEQNYGKFSQAFSQWKGYGWKADPELSVQFELTENGRNESFIVRGKDLVMAGRENAILVMDISVNNVDPLNTKHDGITVFVTNLSGLNDDLDQLTKEERANKFQATLIENIEFNTTVKKHYFLSIPFSSDIYEIWVVRQPKDGEPFTGVQVSLQMDVSQQPVQQQKSGQSTLTPQQQDQMVLAVKQIVQQNNLTFLDSLQLWEKVEQQRRQHEQSYEWNEAIELYECMGLLMMYVVEYAILRFIARKKQVV